MENASVISHQTLLNILDDLLPFKYFHIALLCFLYLVSNHYNSIVYGNYIGLFPSTVSIVSNSEKIRIFYDIYLLYFLSVYFFMVFRYFLKGLSKATQREFFLAHKSGLKLRKNKISPDPNANIVANCGIVLSLLVPLLCFFVFGMMNIGNTKFFIGIFNGSNIFLFIFLVQLSLSNIYSILFSVTLMEMKKYVLLN